MIREKNIFHSQTRDPKRLLLRRADTERDNLTTAGGLELRHSSFIVRRPITLPKLKFLEGSDD